MSVQTSVLPTALLSTHTGGFSAPVCTDEAEFCRAALAQYHTLGLQFNGIYSGYLAQPAHAQLVLQAMEQNPHALKVVDPVLGDNGKLYSAITPQACQAMTALCAHADVLCPNVTESALLLGLAPCDTPMDAAALAQRLDALLRAYPQARAVVITGAQLPDGTRVNAVGQPDGCTLLPYTPVARSCHGTGDLFAAILTGGLLQGLALPTCVELAAAFVGKAVAHTAALSPDPRMGVVFEPLLGELAAEVTHLCNR
jgi:pyridoxine kinase